MAMTDICQTFSGRVFVAVIKWSTLSFSDKELVESKHHSMFQGRHHRDVAFQLTLGSVIDSLYETVGETVKYKRMTLAFHD